jgi:predicted negative regulator of RcsB-dependent stress response
MHLFACLFAGCDDNAPPFMDAQTQTTDVYFRVLAWLHAHRKPLLIGSVVAAVIGLVWGFLAWKKAQDETDANAQLFAVPLEGGPRSASASPLTLLDLAKEYPSTPAGEYAQLLAADLLFNEAKYQEAARQFSDFAENHPESALVSVASVGVAASLEAQGKTAEAISKYHDIIVMYPSELSIISPAKLTLARLYQEDGKPQLAFNYYAELARMLSQNPYDPWASEARERAQLLVAKYPDLLKSQTNAAPSGVPSSAVPGFSVSDSSKAAGATSAPQPSKPAAPANKQVPPLLKIPGPSSNSTGKP